MLAMASVSSIYLHKQWSSDAQKFANTVALNPRTQRKYVWSIAQMQRFNIPPQSLLIKGKFFANLTVNGIKFLISPQPS